MTKEDCKELNMTLQEATHLTWDRRVTIDERLTHAVASLGPRRRDNTIEFRSLGKIYHRIIL